jgi:MFS family permease
MTEWPIVPVARRRRAMIALFFVPGIGLSSWVTRTPAIKELLAASTLQMSIALFGVSIGSMTGILSAGHLVARFDARAVIAAATASVTLCLPTVGVGAAFHSIWAVTLGFALFGLGAGAGEVALNVEGAAVESALEKPFLPVLHGYFSVGLVVGSVMGIGFTAINVPVLWHLVGISVGMVVLFVCSMPFVARGTGRTPSEVEAADTSVAPVWKDTRVLLIGAIVLAIAFTEGTANDWLPLIMVDGHGLSATLGSFVYAIFSAAMVLGRFGGGPFIQRFGHAHAFRVSAVSAALGLGLVSLVDNQIVAMAAVVLWGIGASLGFPVAISAAGGSGPNAAARVTFVATLGYLAFLVGPPLLGFLGQHYGLRTALLAPLVGVVCALFLIGRAVPGHCRAPDAEPMLSRQ